MPTGGAWLYRLVGGNVDKWYYFSSEGAQATLNNGIINHTGSWLNFGIIAGALVAVLLASQFKFKKIKSLKQVVAATLGGLLMGYGARLAGGCNIGALYSSIASLSLSGWVFVNFPVYRSLYRQQAACEILYVKGGLEDGEKNRAV